MALKMLISDNIAHKSDGSLCSIAAEWPVKFVSNFKSINASEMCSDYERFVVIFFCVATASISWLAFALRTTVSSRRRHLRTTWKVHQRLPSSSNNFSDFPLLWASFSHSYMHSYTYVKTILSWSTFNNLTITTYYTYIYNIYSKEHVSRSVTENICFPLCGGDVWEGCEEKCRNWASTWETQNLKPFSNFCDILSWKSLHKISLYLLSWKKIICQSNNANTHQPIMSQYCRTDVNIIPSIVWANVPYRITNIKPFWAEARIIWQN